MESRRHTFILSTPARGILSVNQFNLRPCQSPDQNGFPVSIDDAPAMMVFYRHLPYTRHRIIFPGKMISSFHSCHLSFWISGHLSVLPSGIHAWWINGYHAYLNDVFLVGKISILLESFLSFMTARCPEGWLDFRKDSQNASWKAFWKECLPEGWNAGSVPP